MKKIILFTPEYLILLLCLYWFVENLFSSQNFNYVALTTAVIVILQLFFKFKFLGFFIATIITVISLYMSLAVISEFRDFATINSEAIQLLLVGLSLCFLGLLSSAIMFYKYAATAQTLQTLS